MNNIGRRIRELRKKNDLTQEKLADFLGVTYQSVSKWECGTTLPDFAMIVPLARVLRVSADELLGMKPAGEDERKAYFDAEYFQYWKKDHEEDLEIARQAVAEYPGDCRYLCWLASNEWYVGYSVKYMGTDTEKELIASCIRHYEMVLENCDDPELRNDAISGLVYAYECTHRYDEAKKYAMMYPEEPETNRDAMLVQCLRGKERELQCKKIIRKSLIKLCGALTQLRYCYETPEEDAAVIDVEESVIKAVITDGNYQHFDISLSILSEERAKLAMRAGDHDAAVQALALAMKHAVDFDRMDADGAEHYTTPVLAGYTEDHSENRKEDWSMTGDVRNFAEHELFRPLREREDFRAIFASE
ncbi:MAG: helix-turn-helix transcriptional regulator [Clostridia bacterium]|nr:helix-turn-helix transcriptional regulator [Clostridia bacterium]